MIEFTLEISNWNFGNQLTIPYFLTKHSKNLKKHFTSRKENGIFSEHSGKERNAEH